MQEAVKSYKELNFSDDFLFGKILQTNPEVCKQLLEMILARKIRMLRTWEETKEPEVQKAIRITDDGKGIRLDVYLEGDDEVYDIEMQTTLNADLPKRTRYYQGMIDLNLIEKGAVYSQLHKSYIIFICLQDPFGKGKCVYVFENRCRDIPELLLGDESVKVFLNATGDKSGIPKELANFLDYLAGRPASDSFTKKLDTLVQKARDHEEWEVEFMTLFHIRQQERAEGRAEGRAETLIKMIRKGYSKEAILDLDYTEEEYSKAEAEVFDMT